MNRAKRIPPLAASNSLWGGRGAGNMPRRHDLLERLTPDNPNYAIGRKFYLEAWADSHFLVAEAHAGRVSFSDFVDGCAQTFSQAAQTHVAIKDETPIPARCRAVDDLTRKFIRQFAKTVALESNWLGEAQVAAGIDALSWRVNEIAARSKQQILEAALAEQSGESLDTPKQLHRRYLGNCKPRN